MNKRPWFLGCGITAILFLLATGGGLGYFIFRASDVADDPVAQQRIFEQWAGRIPNGFRVLAGWDLMLISEGAVIRRDEDGLLVGVVTAFFADVESVEHSWDEPYFVQFDPKENHYSFQVKQGSDAEVVASGEWEIAGERFPWKTIEAEDEGSSWVHLSARHGEDAVLLFLTRAGQGLSEGELRPLLEAILAQE